MTTDTNPRQTPIYATTDSSIGQDEGAQNIGRDLFYHRYIYRPYESSAETNPMIRAALNVYKDKSRISDYDVLDFSAMFHDIGHMLESFSEEGMSEEIKFIAKRVSRSLEETRVENEALEVHDYREDGLTMDWKEAEELCRRMMEE